MNHLILKKKVNITISSAIGLGLLPVMPGTFGALLGVIIHEVTIISFPYKYQLPVLLFFFLLVCIGNHILTPWAEQYWQAKDPKQFVLDEVAGYLLVPILFHHGKPWQIMVWGFIIFRIYDIIKLPIARKIDKELHGAWGILLDDLVSSVYTVITLYGLLWLSHALGYENWLIA